MHFGGTNYDLSIALVLSLTHEIFDFKSIKLSAVLD